MTYSRLSHGTLSLKLIRQLLITLLLFGTDRSCVQPTSVGFRVRLGSGIFASVPFFFNSHSSAAQRVDFPLSAAFRVFAGPAVSAAASKDIRGSLIARLPAAETVAAATSALFAASVASVDFIV